MTIEALKRGKEIEESLENILESRRAIEDGDYLGKVGSKLIPQSVLECGQRAMLTEIEGIVAALQSELKSL